jgi:Ca2+-binding RTX toxin-like protein
MVNVSSSHSGHRPTGTRYSETLRGGEGPDTIEGFGGNDTLIGNGGDDALFGGRGNDQLSGGAGDDFLLGGSGTDRFDGGSGFDTISFSDTDAKHGAVANLASGRIEDDGFGNAETLRHVEGFSGGTLFADRFSGNDGDNSFFLDKGDRAWGAGGDDSFLINGAASIYGGKGRDSVAFTSETYGLDEDGCVAVVKATHGVNLQLGLGTLVDGFGNHATVTSIEEALGTRFADTLTGGDEANALLGGNGADLLQGSGGNDTLWGEADNDSLSGGDGYDWLFGEAGADFLSGSDGHDTLVGGAGRDTLMGETGGDVFLFEDGDTGATRGTADFITDFSHVAGDRIDLSCVDAKRGGGDNAFKFIGDDAFSGHAGELRFEHDGSDLWVMGDTNGDSRADLMIRIDFASDLTKADFIL